MSVCFILVATAPSDQCIVWRVVVLIAGRLEFVIEFNDGNGILVAGALVFHCEAVVADGTAVGGFDVAAGASTFFCARVR